MAKTEMKVTLIEHTPHPEELIAKAGKLCYSASGIDEITEDLSGAEIFQFVNKLADLGHESPMEHVSFTFGIEGVSRALSHQLVRHRIASYSQQSQRYVRLDQFDYITPSAIEQCEDASDIFDAAMKETQKAYDAITDILKHNILDGMVMSEVTQNKNLWNLRGLSIVEMKSRLPENILRKLKSKAEKQAIEDARYVFPNACETKIIVTMNVRSLLNFFEHRCCNRAQWEIRAMAWKMLEIVKKTAPAIFSKAGPSCLHGACKENSMTCGTPYR